MPWLGATSVLLLIAIVMIVALPRIFRKPASTQIHAVRNAEDIVEYPAEESASEKTVYHRSKEESQPHFKIRYGRVAVFCLGALAMITALVLSVLASLTSLTWNTPLASLLVAVVCLVGLRLAAIRDAKARGARYRQEKQVAETVLESDGLPVNKPPVEVESARRQQPQQARGSRQRPVNQAAKSLRYARTHGGSVRPRLQGTAGQAKLPVRETIEEPFTPANSNWQPTEIPKPTYLKVAEVKRKLPEPVQLPEYQKSETKSLQEAQELANSLTLDEILRRRRA